MSDDPTIPPRPSNSPMGPLDIAATEAGPSTPGSSGSGGLSGSAGLAAGTVVMDRYRLVSMLGKGGMGEVWRADDLVLGTSVALKFLLGAPALDPLRLERFRAEVRLSRQVAHANVCRVYDIAEAKARVFLSMEFIDGEDMASLLRRIGRLPREKAVEVARQLCLGLAAAHEQGVVHRDLKPANVMIDGRGKVRITDFGLAVLGGEGAGGAVVGTPLYMAPEQLAGAQASKRSDLYALGLVLYELFTGRPAHQVGERATIADIRRLHESHAGPASPSTIVPDIDPTVERVILRCLEKDPARRPPSALAVAAALPGGDPLAAALAAGETPSPEMVALSGGGGTLSGRAVAAALLLMVVAMGVVLVLGDQVSLLRRVPMELSPDVLKAKAREIVRGLGYADPPRDIATGFSVQSNAMGAMRSRFYQEQEERKARGEAVDENGDPWVFLADATPPGLTFWYRQSPLDLAPDSFHQRRAAMDSPVHLVAESVTLQLDTTGRLVMLEGAAPVMAEEGAAKPEPDWGGLLKLAGLDITKMTAVEPKRAPWYSNDERRAWTGAYRDREDIPLRVEAAADRGRITSFRMMPPWYVVERTVRPAAKKTESSKWKEQLLLLPNSLLFGGLFIASVILGIRNMRAGRGDKRGAFRFAIVIALVSMLSGILWAHDWRHVFVVSDWPRDIANGLWHGAQCWLVYMALEPSVRRQWPGMLVSWARFLDGGVNDPMVARDVLIGGLGGLCIAAFSAAALWVFHVTVMPVWPHSHGLDCIDSPRFALAKVMEQWAGAAFLGVALTFLLVGLRAVLKRDWLTLVAAVAICTLVQGLNEGGEWLSFMVVCVGCAVMMTLVVKVGLVALCACFFVMTLMTSVPLTTDLGRWYSGVTVLMVLLAAAPMVRGAYVSLGRGKAV